jgi:type IV pilus assembly protein PilA
MNKQKGFTLIELMIVVAIIGILAAVAIPSYQNYTRRAAYTEVLTAMSAVKTSIGVCLSQAALVTECDSFVKIGMPAPVGAGAVNNITITAGTAAINATPNPVRGIAAGDTCTLAPVNFIANQPVVWTYSGVCLTNGYAKN